MRTCGTFITRAEEKELCKKRLSTLPDQLRDEARKRLCENLEVPIRAMKR
jgi:hypothetical protein